MVFALFWVSLGLVIGAFIWTPIAIRENDRRWRQRLRPMRGLQR